MKIHSATVSLLSLAWALPAVEGVTLCSVIGGIPYLSELACSSLVTEQHYTFKVAGLEDRGRGLSISPDGRTISYQTSTGIVMERRNTFGSWEQLGDEIPLFSESSSAVAYLWADFSWDGNTIAIGYMGEDQVVRVYEASLGCSLPVVSGILCEWRQKGPTIQNPNNIPDYWNIVSISGDGNILAVATLCENVPNQVFYYSIWKDSWELIGDFLNIPTDEYLGVYGDSLSMDGSVFAVTSFNENRRIELYQYGFGPACINAIGANVCNWKLIATIDPNDGFSDIDDYAISYFTSISGDGSTVVFEYDRDVYVFRYAIEGTSIACPPGTDRVCKWQKVGAVEVSSDKDRYLTLSHDGNFLAVSSWDNTASKGKTYVYKANIMEKTYEEVAVTNDGGFETKISADGSWLVTVDKAGNGYVYEIKLF